VIDIISSKKGIEILEVEVHFHKDRREYTAIVKVTVDNSSMCTETDVISCRDINGYGIGTRDLLTRLEEDDLTDEARNWLGR